MNGHGQYDNLLSKPLLSSALTFAALCNLVSESEILFVNSSFICSNSESSDLWISSSCSS